MEASILSRIITSSVGLVEAEVMAFLDEVFHGRAPKPATIAFVAALSAKPLVLTDILAFVRYVDRTSPARKLPGVGGAVNVVGTGGGLPTFNISTTVAFVAAAAGATVLKSGASRYSSASGSLDVLSALGVPTPRDDDALANMIGEVGVGFPSTECYTPLLRRIAAAIAPLSLRDLGGFVNVVGPLICPYEVEAQLIGVGRAEHLDVLAAAMHALRRPRTLLVHAGIGLDEFSSVGENKCRWVDGEIVRIEWPGAHFGFEHGGPDGLRGGSPQENATILREILTGRRRGVARDTVVFNAGVLLHIARVTDSVEAGIRRAAEALDNGSAVVKLEAAVAWGRKALSGAGPRCPVVPRRAVEPVIGGGAS